MTFPTLLDYKDVARIVKRSERAVLEATRRGTMSPPPITDKRGDYVRPHRWHPDTVQKFLNGQL